MTTLAGNIPKEIGLLDKLMRLMIGINEFSGSIPREIGNMTALFLLHIYTNNLSGKT